MKTFMRKMIVFCAKCSWGGLQKQKKIKLIERLIRKRFLTTWMWVSYLLFDLLLYVNEIEIWTEGEVNFFSLNGMLYEPRYP